MPFQTIPSILHSRCRSLADQPARPSVRYPRRLPTALPPQDKQLVQILDAALHEAEWRSGDWLICKPGCTPCCIGVFAIDQLDALRLQAGLAKLDETDPSRAA